MNFEFSQELDMLRDQARRMLAERSSIRAVRDVLEGRKPWDRALWQEMAGLGWLGAAVPERFGGVGLGHEGLCVIAEEVGRAIAPVPFTSSVSLATEALLAWGSDAQRAQWLPSLAAGERIGCFALAEGPGQPGDRAITASLRGGRLNGSKWPVADGGIADLAIVATRDEDGTATLAIVDLTQAGVSRRSLETIDPTREHSRLDFADVRAEPLGEGAALGWAAIARVLDRAAVLIAFEQIGIAQRCLQMATTYAKERHAFGRPIGSFQAIKHKLADVYIALELARSNAYYGAWALQADAPELPLAAASARVGATDAAQLASKENIQTHGGMGITWEVDAHLFHRRAKLLGLAIGGNAWWKDQLVTRWGEQLQRQAA
ncbi:MAG: acyl-CoA dehydrogenase family protein [Burkholderiaceae bacterium]